MGADAASRPMPGTGAAPDPVLRLAALVDIDAEGAARLSERLRLSNAMRDRLAGLAPPWPLDPAGDEQEQRRALYRLGAERVRDLALLLAAEGRLDRERLAEMLACAAAWETPRFPIAGRDVTALGIPPGPRIGRLLAAVRGWWEEGDFRADRAACLARLKELIEQGAPIRPAIIVTLLTAGGPPPSLGAMLSRSPRFDRRRCRCHGGARGVRGAGGRSATGSARPALTSIAARSQTPPVSSRRGFCCRSQG